MITGSVRVLLADPLQQFEAVDAGHADIADHHVRLLVSRGASSMLPRRRSTPG
jgi:hypothetical protein